MTLGRPENRFAAQARGNLDRYLMLVAATRYPPDAQFAQSTADAAVRLATGGQEGDALDPEAWSLVAWNLFRAHHYRQVIQVLDAAAVVHPQRAVSAGFEVWRRAAEVNLDEGALEFSEDVLTAALRAADDSLGRQDVESALFLLEGACEVAFAVPSNVSHVDALLYRDPGRVLAPLQSARVWQLVTGPPPPDSRCAPAPTGRRSRVVVTPGPFASFASPVIAALERAGANVRVHDPAQLAPRFQWLGLDPTALRDVFDQSLGLGRGPSPTLVDPFRAADVIWCDWADQSAVLASRLAPADCRIVVRVHGADATSPWLHLVDWERVGDVIFVSEHLRSMVRRQLGDRLDSTQQHVVPNLVELDRFTTTKDPSADRTLGMVGWAQVVKDPLWTIEVLALLRSIDPEWRLVMFGRDFADFERADERRYAKRFRRRVLDDDVRDAITFAGYVPDLPHRLGGVGYALSSSLRESQGVGLVEMVASGAVPVVRDWPMYRDYGGARSLFPTEWVVESPSEAVSRILATSTERDRVARECRQHVLSTNDPHRIAEQYCAIILGD
jgi:glycosyltransferase involved in cell wall biosynthesis